MLELINKILTLANTSLTNRSEVDKAGQKLERLVLPVVDEMQTSQQIYIIDELKKENSLSKIQALYEVYETNLENTFIEEFMTSNMATIEHYRMYDRFVSLIQHEIELGGINADSKVAFIGSGPLPITAILLNQLSGCKVDCYEHYLPAAEVSQTCVDRLNKKKEISIFHKPGQRIDASPYSTVIVALLAKPKKSILEQLAATKSRTSNVLCRTSDGLRQVFYETTFESDITRFKIADKIAAYGNETISSIRLTE